MLRTNKRPWKLNHNYRTIQRPPESMKTEVRAGTELPGFLHAFDVRPTGHCRSLPFGRSKQTTQPLFSSQTVLAKLSGIDLLSALEEGNMESEFARSC